MKLFCILMLVSISALIGGRLNGNPYDGDSLTTIESKSEEEVKKFTSFFLESINDYQYLKMSSSYKVSDDNWIVKSDQLLSKDDIVVYGNYIPVLSCDTIPYYKKEIKNINMKASIISFKDNSSSNFYFSQSNGSWALLKTETSTIKSLQDSTFLNFLNSFTSDMEFQAEHIATPLISCGVGDMEVICDTISKERWFSIYGNSLDFEQLITFNLEEESDIRVVKLSGIANGCNQKYTFKRSDNVWKLVKVEDYSM